MAKKDKGNTMDKDSKKRLETLAKEWDKSPGIFSNMPSDLRLLLEHHAPLRELIRSIAAQAITEYLTAHTAHAAETPQHPHTPAEHAAQAAFEPAPTSALEQTQAQIQQQEQAQIQEEQAQALATAQQALAQAHAELENIRSAYNRLKQETLDTADKLTQCSASAQQLLQDKTALTQTNATLGHNCQTLEQERQQLRQQLQQTQQQLQQTHKELRAHHTQLAQRSQAPAELGFLRSDNVLAQKMELDNLPDDDTQALVQVVAVLAQRNNLERLWNALKERCDTDHRPASTAERALLQTALGWYNHNWRTQPYRLTEPALSSGYDYQQHQRSRHTPSGETITALHLPGLADGKGKLLGSCKALVSTQ